MAKGTNLHIKIKSDRAPRSAENVQWIGLTRPHGPSWYQAWLSSQFEELPSSILDIFHVDHERCTSESHWECFVSAFLAISECIASTSAITIDGIIIQLLEKSVIATDASYDSLQYARYFVFSVLGWQTMLFKPAHPTEPVHQLTIEEQRGCCEYTHMSLQQDMRVCEQDPLSEFLMGFGVLLPSKNICLNDDQDVLHIFHQQVEVSARTFNAYNLSSITGIRIKWVDTLACHLAFNASTRELSLFQCPSFCQFCLLTYESLGQGSIHACATTSKLRCQWATEDEVNQLLREILLSYRLLFGQTKRSRVLFRSLNPFAQCSKPSRDPLLSTLCGKKPCFPGLVQKERYYLSQDFPVLRYRIAVLQRQLATTTPCTWVQLWRDKRDSANWLTFWAVIFFGAFGSLMSLLQVVLQFV
ncbi:hypothetical protein BO94DRAFT_580724 [Aspergillus sclerotioniger CBS 115572]|uniref:Uncharacterized protein n=1 Tax=Aspergillus sclerotioniger CBS 115572 TaxID=1450535 RepID=A0A317XAE1_9EURO|nr:hypothetical protein BO94DRAFT_580724 [Aspergillus sclerotioniger CBS 115572]PWY95534.1 hypothetical protein BO94DRAFT_580724 [Aspergillus sclerotioniger CBS 115572]